MRRVIVDDCAAHRFVVRFLLPLATSRKERAVFHVVGRQGIHHEDDVLGSHCRSPQVPMNLSNEGRRLGLKRTLHNRLSVVCVGQRLAVQARAGVHPALLPRPSFLTFYPIGTRRWIEAEQGRRRKQVTSIQLPLIAVKRGELPAIRALSPAQAAMRKKELCKSDAVPAWTFQLIEPLRGALIQRIPWPVSLGPLHSARRDQMSEIMRKMKGPRR